MIRDVKRPSKAEAFAAFLNDGWVSLHIDARRDGVVVPDALRAAPHLVLQYGLNMPVPIADLKVTDVGVQATLSFSRVPHTTLVPWSAVYIVACTDGRGVIYEEDAPPEFAAELARAARQAQMAEGAEAEAAGTKPRAGKSSADKTAAPEAAASESAPAASGKRSQSPSKAKRARRKGDQAETNEGGELVPSKPAEAESALPEITARPSVPARPALAEAEPDAKEDEGETVVAPAKRARPSFLRAVADDESPSAEGPAIPDAEVMAARGKRPKLRLVK